MNAAGGSIDDLSACEDGTAATSASQLFSDHGRQKHLQPEFMARSMPALKELSRAREHCDVVFRFPDGAEFWAHRFVLAARYAGCGVFLSGSEHRTGFLVEWTPEHEDIAWPSLSKAVVSDLSSKTFELLIDLAGGVQIHGRVGLHNDREVLDVGAGHSDVRIFHKVWATNSEFHSLMPDELFRMPHDDKLHAPNEVKCAFGDILKWIAGNIEDRRLHLPRFLPMIRFAFCSRAYMAQVESDPLVHASEQALEALFVVKCTLSQEAVSDVYWRTRPDLFERRWLKPRVPKGVLMFGGCTGGASNHLLTYNCRSNRWLLQPHQNTYPRAYHGVAMLGGLIYSVGGFDNYPVVTLDVSRHKGTSRSNMKVAHCYFCVAVLQGYIYAVGGFEDDDRTSS
ncbi:kelch-like protein 10 [Haemaphysalis longicornis]